MTNKEYFQQAFWLDIQKETLHAEAESLRPFAQKNEKTAILLERIEAEIDAVIRHQEEIRAVIAALPTERERAVLRCRYLCKMKWEDIAAASAIHKKYGHLVSEIKDPDIWDDIVDRIKLGLTPLLLSLKPKRIFFGGPLGFMLNTYRARLRKSLAADKPKKAI